MPTPNSNTCLLRLERVDDSGGALAISFGIEFEVGGDGVVLASAGLQCFYREIFGLITFWRWIYPDRNTQKRYLELLCTHSFHKDTFPRSQGS